MTYRTSYAILLAMLLIALPVAGRAQAKDAVPGQTVVVVAGKQYTAGGMHRFLLGDDYRDLWTLPIRVQVLDLRTYAGGLKPAFLQMNEGAGNLDEPFVKRAIRAVAVRQPEFLQDIMGFVKQSTVETLEVAEIAGIQLPSLEIRD